MLFQLHSGNIPQCINQHFLALRTADGIFLVENEEGNARDTHLLGGVDFRNNRVVAFPDLGAETAPGDPNGPDAMAEIRGAAE